MATFTLTASCPDQIGIIAAVSGFLAEHGGSIVEASQHSDQVTGWFFMRYEFLADGLPFDLDGFCAAFAPLAEKFGMQCTVRSADVPCKVLILVSREDHCLNDLLYRWRSRDFRFDVVAVLSNHESLHDQVAAYGLPFHHVPIVPATREQSFAQVERIFLEYGADVMVLARYMQILPVDLCHRYANRIINIHHSFLPSFAGAQPYRQAYERGVKIIGATCHYVTPELDAGPIIEQDVIRVAHGDTVERMIAFGRDVEKTVLARGLRYHVQGRVLVHGNKTVVFP
ncbi:MAG: formyltetrahydrofolate deformylase [Pseudomonadota bacterium]|nr:formyltetrahydrofolate deformylase [Pseudomonadota bacterium]